MTSPLVLTVEQAAERLGPICSVSWLKKHAQAGSIPFRKSGEGRGRAGRIGFTEDDLKVILRQLLREPSKTPMPDEYLPVTRRRSA